MLCDDMLSGGRTHSRAPPGHGLICSQEDTEMTLNETKSAMSALEEAIQGSDPEAVLTSLRSLHKIQVDREILSETRVGVLVNKVRKLEWIGKDAMDEACR